MPSYHESGIPYVWDETEETEEDRKYDLDFVPSGKDINMEIAQEIMNMIICDRIEYLMKV